MAVVAKYTAQAVFMVEPHVKQAVDDEAEKRNVSQGEVWREIVDAGIAAREAE